MVSTASLAQQAERLHLGDALLLGRGEEKTGGRRKHTLLADAYEALIADPEIEATGLRVTPETRERKIRYALSNNIGLGGHNGAVVLRRWNGR